MSCFEGCRVPEGDLSAADRAIHPFVTRISLTLGP